MPDRPQPLPTYTRSGRPIARYVAEPVQRFVREEAAGGIVLFGATVVAIAWANSPWRDSYEHLWHTTVSLRVGGVLSLSESLESWITDALMTLFFFVVGLEIKQELVHGDLADRRQAMLPALAALGGMVVPAVIYFAWNHNGEAAHGWGIPMATDIAFALGVVSLLGPRVPSTLKVFLLTLAIADDLGAILVIAIFYTSNLSMRWLGCAVVLLALLRIMRLLHIWYIPLYVIVGALLWLAMYESGVHATIAGVALGLLTPARPLNPAMSIENVGAVLEAPDLPEVDRVLQAATRIRESRSVAERLQYRIHPWTTLVVVPLFALASAGVHITGDKIRDAVTSPVTIGIALGLVVGKLVGVATAAIVGIHTGLAPRPEGTTDRQLAGIGAVAGVGFTVALFISNLAFDDPVLRDEARIGLLAGSIVAAALGAALLGFRRRTAEVVVET
jgi:NhaA family Na+:H+ antiporter